MKNSKLRWVFVLGSLTFFNACGPTAETTINPLSQRLQGHACQVWRDERAIAHVRGQTELETIACMGYQHARDRAWQMDDLRRAAQGRRAEVWGFSRVKTDFVLRLLGLAEKAKALFDAMPREQQDFLWAYTHGVNQGFEQALRDGVYEFETLHYRPEPWRPWDTTALLLLQSFDQTRQTFERDFKEMGWLQAHGQEAEALFNPDGMPWDTSILKPGEFRTAAATPASKPSATATPAALWAELFPEQETGSNNWVVAPARSQSGHAWLANDPHLELKYPPFWYWIHIEGGGLDAIGASLPGVPVIASGANRNVSWGLTNAFLDVGDIAVVAEKDLKDAVSERPRIDFKWGPLRLPMVFKSFRRTREGWPVLPIEAAGSSGVPVLRWTGLEVTPEDMTSLFSLMKVKSVAEADSKLSHVGLPSWNFVFADTSGSIGYRAVGKIPKRTRIPHFGAGARDLSELRGQGYLSPQEMPHVTNPARGFIATANNRQWPPEAAFHAGRAHSPAFRGYRIEELLKATPKHDLESLQHAQCDIQAVDARFILPGLLRLLDRAGYRSKNELDATRMNHLRTWDYESGPRCMACVIYRRWTDRLRDTEHLDDVALYRSIQAAEAQPSSAFETRMIQQLALALADLEGHADISWEQMHRLDFDHQSGDARFSADSIWSPGDTQAVNPGKANWDPEARLYRHSSGASQRLIVEMTSPPSVYSVLPGDNRDLRRTRDAAQREGNPWVAWRDCKLERRAFPLDWSKLSSVEKIGL